MLILRNFRIIDETMETFGSLIIENGFISELIPRDPDFPDNILLNGKLERAGIEAGQIIDGLAISRARGNTNYESDGSWKNLAPIIMPAFVDLHAHFRDPGFLLKETLESASLAAAAGGYGTVVCMGNTDPVLDTAEAVGTLKERADALALVDLYPVMTLTKGMAGKELSGLRDLPDFVNVTNIVTTTGEFGGGVRPRLLSEDGKDLADERLFLMAMKEARRAGVPVSCHCDFGGDEASAARAAGKGREVWSRVEENNATRRAIELGRRAGCHLHIAHVSTKEAAEMVRAAKADLKAGAAGGFPAGENGFTLTCEATPHHLALTEERAAFLGAESHGRVNPSLRSEEDRRAIIAAIQDGTIDAIATDHAPHTGADKAAGAPGFTGLETAFAVCRTELVKPGCLDLRRLSALMSAAPARILGLSDRGRIAKGLRADLVIAAPDAPWTVEPGTFKSRGKNSPYIGMELRGTILMTLNRGRIVFDNLNSERSK